MKKVLLLIAVIVLSITTFANTYLSQVEITRSGDYVEIDYPNGDMKALYLEFEDCKKIDGFEIKNETILNLLESEGEELFVDLIDYKNYSDKLFPRMQKERAVYYGKVEGDSVIIRKETIILGNKFSNFGGIYLIFIALIVFYLTFSVFGDKKDYLLYSESFYSNEKHSMEECKKLKNKLLSYINSPRRMLFNHAWIFVPGVILLFTTSNVFGAIMWSIYITLAVVFAIILFAWHKRLKKNYADDLSKIDGMIFQRITVD